MNELYVHSSADVDDAATVGLGAKIWHGAQVREGAVVGENCIVGKNVYVGAGVTIGPNCKVQNNAALYEGLTLEAGAFVGPSAVFTNDRNPRAINSDGSLKAPDDWDLGRTVVRYGATVGASSTVLPGLVIGRWALVGAGSVVTRDVRDHELVKGNPARQAGWVCSCGKLLSEALDCEECKATYVERDSGLQSAD